MGGGAKEIESVWNPHGHTRVWDLFIHKVDVPRFKPDAKVESMFSLLWVEAVELEVEEEASVVRVGLLGESVVSLEVDAAANRGKVCAVLPGKELSLSHNE